MPGSAILVKVEGSWTNATLEGVVAKQVERKDRPVRLSEAAIQWARIASGYTGESMAEYVSRVVAERGKADAEEMHAKLTAEPTIDAPRAKKGGAKSGEK